MPEPASRRKPISAVFVLDTKAVVGPMLAGWLAAGNRIAAIVLPPQRRPGRRASFGSFRRGCLRRLFVRRYIGGRDVPLIELGPPYDWNPMIPRLAGLNADLLICFAFPRQIPEPVLALFPKGGLNLHPALLPHYRGPHPIHCLVIDDECERYGGVTLHKMTPRFDDGDILAQIPLAKPAWTSMPDLLRALAGSLEKLVVEAVPDHCEGKLSGAPQPPGTFRWALVGSEPLVVSPATSSRRAAQLSSFVGRFPGVCVSDGAPIRLGTQLVRYGPPTGRAPRRYWGIVLCDFADGRFVHLAYGSLSKRLTRLRRLFWWGAPTPPIAIRRFGKDTPDPES